jgi:hypothetical protein
VSKIDHSSRSVGRIVKLAMKKELSVHQSLAVSCPTCGAAPGERCELSSGQPRYDPHRDRREIAKDAAKTK